MAKKVTGWIVENEDSHVGTKTVLIKKISQDKRKEKQPGFRFILFEEGRLKKLLETE